MKQWWNIMFYYRSSSGSLCEKILWKQVRPGKGRTSHFARQDNTHTRESGYISMLKIPASQSQPNKYWPRCPLEHRRVGLLRASCTPTRLEPVLFSSSFTPQSLVSNIAAMQLLCRKNGYCNHPKMGINHFRAIPIPNINTTYTNHIFYLVGGFNHVENMKVNGKDYPIYYGK